MVVDGTFVRADAGAESVDRARAGGREPLGRLQPMCGIVGYVGRQQPNGKPLEVVLEGLRRLEYRGYDSAGVALVGLDGVLVTAKKAGKLVNLTDELGARPLPAATAAPARRISGRYNLRIIDSHFPSRTFPSGVRERTAFVRSRIAVRFRIVTRPER